MTIQQPTNEDIEQVIEQLKSDQWSVEDWDYSTGLSETPKLELTLEFSRPAVGRDSLVSVRDAVDRFDDGDGADKDKVMQAVDGGEQAVERLMQRGEIYENRAGFLKVT